MHKNVCLYLYVVIVRIAVGFAIAASVAAPMAYPRTPTPSLWKFHSLAIWVYFNASRIPPGSGTRQLSLGHSEGARLRTRIRNGRLQERK